MINIKDPKDCCGCTACSCICPHGAIHMQLDNKGFMYPHVDNSVCVQCGLCLRTCPVIDRKKIISKTSNVECSFALRHKNKEVLYQSSSGGAFWAIAEYVISNKGVVFGAVYSDNLVVKHTLATTLDDCKKFQGSKYSQSDLTGIYHRVKEYLLKGQLVLFTGTPCQNHGLLRFLRKQYENLITVDIICHSVPSPNVFRDYIRLIEKEYKDKVDKVSMRDKTLGWGGIDSYRYYFKSGKEVLNPQNIKCWQLVFESGLITRESCFDCQYTNLNRVTDFTIGDFWDAKGLRPDIKSKEGTSIVLVNSEKGKSILHDIEKHIQLWVVTEEEYMQPRLQNRTEKPSNYELFWTIYLNKGFNKAYKKFWGKKNIFVRIAYRLNRLVKIK